MKKIFIFVSMLFAVSTAMFATNSVCEITQMTRTAVAPVTINCTAGNLAALINAQGTPIATITDLVVTGTINKVDFDTMISMPALANLDLGGATVEKFSNFWVTYNANEIPEGIFYGMKTLVSIVLPSNITKIGNSTFGACKSLTTVDMPNTVTMIGTDAFLQCNALANINLSTALESIGVRSFSACNAMRDVVFGANLKSIGEYAFLQCNAFLDVRLPEGLTELGTAAFMQCKSLKSIVIPSQIKIINEYLITDCIKLEKIVNMALTPQTIASGSAAFNGIDKYKCKLFVPVGAQSAYKSWGGFTQVAEFNPTAVNTVTANTMISLIDNSLSISSDKMIASVEVMNFDGQLLTRQQCNSSSCSIEVKGVNKVVAKIIYQDGSSQTRKIVGTK